MDTDLKSSFSVLFDFSFRRFITVRLIHILYVLAMIGIGIATLGLIVCRSWVRSDGRTDAAHWSSDFLSSSRSCRRVSGADSGPFRMFENTSAIAEASRKAGPAPGLQKRRHLCKSKMSLEQERRSRCRRG